MKKYIGVVILLFSLVVLGMQNVRAMTEEQFEAIQALLDEASRKSGAPGISVGIVDGEDVYYFSSGDVDEATYYELASVSKSLTALGILLLEEEGELALNDSVVEYIPWLEWNYQGEPVDMRDVTLSDLLYHTSGITNNKHFQDIPQGDSSDMLEQTVRVFQDAELEFVPGTTFQYGTINYAILGLVIETVTGKSYEQFMLEEVLAPIGLEQTFLYPDQAASNGDLVPGYRTTLFVTHSYDAPAFAGNKPAGYIISNAENMVRWMQIQLGQAEDISDTFKRVVEKLHQADQTVSPVDEFYYGGGWFIGADEPIIEHSGVNPNYSTQVKMLPEEHICVAVLGNHADINHLSLVEGVKSILDGSDLSAEYARSAVQKVNLILSAVTIVFVLLTVILIALIARGKRGNGHYKFWGTLTLLLLAGTAYLAPALGYTWLILLIWQPISQLTALISLILFFATVTLYNFRGK